MFWQSLQPYQNEEIVRTHLILVVDRNSKHVLGNAKLYLCIKIVSPLYYCKIAMELMWQIRMQAL